MYTSVCWRTGQWSAYVYFIISFKYHFNVAHGIELYKRVHDWIIIYLNKKKAIYKSKNGKHFHK